MAHESKHLRKETHYNRQLMIFVCVCVCVCVGEITSCYASSSSMKLFRSVKKPGVLKILISRHVQPTSQRDSQNETFCFCYYCMFVLIAVAMFEAF